MCIEEKKLYDGKYYVKASAAVAAMALLLIRLTFGGKKLLETHTEIEGEKEKKQ